jgi:hypothetical protein
MKIFALFFLLLFINVYVHAQEMDDDKSDDIQLGILKVDKITQLDLYSYNTKNSGKRVDSTLVLTMNYTYYDDGHILAKQIKYDKTHTITSFNIFYNKFGKKIKEIVDLGMNSILDVPVNLLNIPVNYEYEYDALGREVTIINYNKDTSNIITHKRIYDGAGKWVKTMVKIESTVSKANTNGFILNDSLFYDPDGKVNRQQFYNRLGVKKSTLLYSYENVGADKEMITIFKETEDGQHFVSKEIFNKYGQITQTSITPYYNPYPSNYDDANKLAKLFYNDNGTLNSCIGYDNGKVLYMGKFFYK